jgi:hypothetical protein
MHETAKIQPLMPAWAISMGFAAIQLRMTLIAHKGRTAGDICQRRPVP